MKDDEITWGEFETRSIVRPPLTPTLHYDPEIEKELANYTWGEFETCSIVRPPIEINLHRVQPCLRVTLLQTCETCVTIEQAMETGAEVIALVTQQAPELLLEYSDKHSRVEQGKLIACLVSHYNEIDVESRLTELIDTLQAAQGAGQKLPSLPDASRLQFEWDYVTLDETNHP